MTILEKWKKWLIPGKSIEQVLKEWEKYDRMLPYQELKTNRWLFSEELGVGKDSSIYNSCYIYGLSNLTVGKSTWIGPNTILDAAHDKLVIGDFCSISAGVQIYTHESVQWALSGGEKEYTHAPVFIGDNCHIGPSAKIFQGVYIPNGFIVGANACVYKGAKVKRESYFRTNQRASIPANSTYHLPYPEEL